MPRIVAAIAVLFAASCGMDPAFAQIDPVHHGAQDIWNDLYPYIVAGLGAFLTALLGLATQALIKLNQKWAAEMLAANAERLARGLTNAAGAVIQRVGAAQAQKLDASHPAVTDAAAEVERRLAPVIKQLGVTPDSLAQRVLEKIPQVLPVDPAPVVVAPIVAAPAAPKL